MNPWAYWLEILTTHQLWVSEDETIWMLDRSRLISDQSVHLFPDWFGESLLPVNHRGVNATLVSGVDTQGGREQTGRRGFIGCLVSKSCPFLSVETAKSYCTFKGVYSLRLQWRAIYSLSYICAIPPRCPLLYKQQQQQQQQQQTGGQMCLCVCCPHCGRPVDHLV